MNFTVFSSLKITLKIHNGFGNNSPMGQKFIARKFQLFGSSNSSNNVVHRNCGFAFIYCVTPISKWFGRYESNICTHTRFAWRNVKFTWFWHTVCLFVLFESANQFTRISTRQKLLNFKWWSRRLAFLCTRQFLCSHSISTFLILFLAKTLLKL